MPALKETIQIVSLVLQRDPGISSALRRTILRELSAIETTECSEADAASLLGVSRATLCKWRQGTWENAPHQFIFRTWKNTADEIRYDVYEIDAYCELWRILCSTSDTRPLISREAMLNYMKRTRGIID